MPPKNGRLIDREATNNSFIDAEERLSLISSENDAADWEETVKRDGWTPLQHRIFNKVNIKCDEWKLDMIVIY